MKCKKLFSSILVTSMLLSVATPIYANDTTSMVSVESTENVHKDIVLDLKEKMHAAESQYNAVRIDNNDQLLKECKDFIQTHDITTLSDTQVNVFIEQQISRGHEKAAITKALVRASMEVVVSGGNLLGFDLSSDLLDHSLQDNPSNLRYSSSTWQTSTLENSNEFNSLVRDFRSELSSVSGDYYTDSGSIRLDDDTDLYLALNNVKYLLGAEKINGRWTIYANIHDTYDFDYWAWSNVDGLTSAMGTALNNYGAMAEDIGAVVSYDVDFYYED